MIQPRVLVVVPTMGSMNANLVATLLAWKGEFADDRLSFYFPYRVAPVDRARNTAVKMFMEHPRTFTHLLFIDSDTVPPLDGLRRLLSHDKDVVSGLTPIVDIDKQTGKLQTFDNCFRDREYDEEGKVIATRLAERHTGLQGIFRCGSSCILIKREVFEALPQPYYLFEYNDDHTEHTRSEDIYFCDQARAAGFALWADTEVICAHHKEAVV